MRLIPYFMIPFFVFLDVWTKQAVVTSFQTTTFYKITPFFNIVLTWNKGMSFGLFNDNHSWFPMIMPFLVPAITIGLLIWMFRTKNTWTKWALSCIISGAIGNLIDRWRYGAVVDFIDVHWYDYHWPAFNLADSYITIGAIVVIAGDFMLKRKAECK